MGTIWYCKKCKRLYKENPGRRCHNGDRIHETSVEMESGYLAIGYKYLDGKKKQISEQYSIETVIENFRKMEEKTVKKEPEEKGDSVKQQEEKEGKFVLTKTRKPPVIDVLPEIEEEPVKKPVVTVKQKEPVKKQKVTVKKEPPAEKTVIQSEKKKQVDTIDLKAELELLGLRKRKK